MAEYLKSRLRALRKSSYLALIVSLFALTTFLVHAVNKLADSDQDGMMDAYEDFFGLDPHDPDDALYNFDDDVLLNRSESALWTDPYRSDTDGDGWADGFDPLPLDHVYIDWGNPQFTEGDAYSYPGPDWWLGATQVDGVWSSNAWFVSERVAKGQGSVLFHIDRDQLSSDLTFKLSVLSSADASLHLDLLDEDRRLTVPNLFGNMLEQHQGLYTPTFRIPLLKHPQASIVRLRRGTGRTTVFETWLGTAKEQNSLPIIPYPETSAGSILENTHKPLDFHETIEGSSLVEVVEVRIGASTDDAEEFTATSEMFLDSTDLEFNEEPLRGEQIVGLRFTEIAIPRGATVLKAFVQYTVDEISTNATSVSFFGHASDDAQAFTAREKDISSRPKTAASIDWIPGPWDVAQAVDQTQQTPNLSAIVQELVDREGWVAGNALVLIAEGTGRRTAVSWDGAPAQAPVLHLEYSTFSRDFPFVAYNDFSWVEGQLSRNITLYTSDNGPGHPPQGSSGYLRDYGSGNVIPAFLSVEGGAWNGDTHTTFGALSRPSTDAFERFDGIVSAEGVLSYGSSDIVLHISGLNPSLSYQVSLFGNRDEVQYLDRFTKTTIAGVERFRNLSSTGANFAGVNDDSVVILHGFNSENGFIARFTQIDPGADGAFSLTVSDGGSGEPPKHYINAFCLEAMSSSPPESPLVTPPESPTQDETIRINGTAKPRLLIEVQGGEEVVSTPSDELGRFDALIPLKKNKVNRLFVTAIDAQNQRSAPTAIQVIQDEQPPSLFIDFPSDGSELSSDTTVVAGRVGDMLSGFMGLDVHINGEPANVIVGIGQNGSFERAVELEVGLNTFTVSATDELGNTTSKQIGVRRVLVNGPQMHPVSGDGQKGTVLKPLTAPVVVKVTRGAGSAFPNKWVTFEVIRSDGRLKKDLQEKDGSPTLQVPTDVNGEAKVFWTIGADAGCGNNRLKVTSQDIAGTVFFCASGDPAPARQINIGSGNNQRSEAGGPSFEPLRVWVNDSCNGVEGIPVTFTVIEGGGKVNGKDSDTVNTTVTGHAQVEFLLGPDQGNNIVEANFVGNTNTTAASFVIYGVERDPAQQTTFSGLILDNSSQPIGGARCFIEVGGEMTTHPVFSDANGQFTLIDVPVGAAHVHIDGLEANMLNGVSIPLGSFPSLSYETTIVPNAENTLATPVLLPALNPLNARPYDGSEDVVLTCDGIDGLKMIVKAGSMRRADGTLPSQADPAILSLNQVHHDNIPMPMPDGAAPPFAWTLQPAGATFDPPIQIEYPNMSGLPVGSIAYFLSFNHDTGRFEIVASGHVVADGSTIVTDPGAGLSVAGWGCNCPPYSVTGSCGQCGGQSESLEGFLIGNDPCKKCLGIPRKNGTPCDDMNPCTYMDECQNGNCTGKPITFALTDAMGAGLANPHRVGMTTGAFNRTQRLRVEVQPPQEAQNVVVAAVGNIRVSNQVVVGGAVEFDLDGTAESANQGDETIIVRHSRCVDIAEIRHPVSVLVPAQIGTPHDVTGNGLVVANRALNSGTSPAIFNVQPPNVILVTVYLRQLTIVVWDQFGGRIGDLYSGSLITEGGQSINQNLTAQSTYIDPVGRFVQKSVNPVVLAGSAAALAWPNDPQEPIDLVMQTQNISVEVDGFVLRPAPAINNRVVNTVPPGMLGPDIVIFW